MNATTKVFIIVNFVLMLGAAWFSLMRFAHEENWKTRHAVDSAKLNDELEAANSQILRLSYDVAEVEVQMHNAQSQISQLQQANEEKDATLQERDRTITDLRIQVNQKNDEVEGLRQQLMQVNNSLELARQRNNELNRITQVARAVTFELNEELAEVEDSLAEADALLDKRDRTINDLEGTLRDRTAYVAYVATNYPQVHSNASSRTAVQGPPVRAVVAAIARNPDTEKQELVMLTVGKDDGISVGMEFIVYRGSQQADGNQYIVKVRAERVMGDMVACRVITDTWNTDGAEIRQGDLAANRLF